MMAKSEQLGIEWAAGSRGGLQRCIRKVIEAIKLDPSRRVPRSDAERANGFSRWLASARVSLEPVLEAEFRREFPTLPQKLTAPGTFRALLDEYVWPEVEEFLRCYAVRGQSAGWVSKHVGDAVTLGWPERIGDRWRVPLGVLGHGEALGQVVLDANGTVIPRLTTSRDEILEVIRARPRSHAAAAAGEQ